VSASRGALGHERKVFALALLAGLPGSALALWLLWSGAWDPSLKLGLSMALVVAWLCLALAVRVRVARSLFTLANMLAALRAGDFTVRGRGASADDALGLALLEANELADTLQQQRLGALEATVLLRRVMAEIEVGVFAFDQERRLRLLNRHAEGILHQPAERVLGRSADELGLAVCLGAEPVRTLELAFPGRAGRWLMRRSTFRQGGHPHQLVVLSDASSALREEEQQAWQRLVRVLSHEINNSLTPISSIADSLTDLLERPDRTPDQESDLRSGLRVIAGRSEGLRRIMASYARLARLPPPVLAPVDVEKWIRRVAAVETRLPVEVVAGPPVEVRADGDQLDQLLINLLSNAVDATLETGGRVRTGWSRADGQVLVWVEDDGPGIADSANLFVPFFSTKPGGSGIGLALSRQIAAGHAGDLRLENRADARGCRAELRLPLAT
jgi:nitrogen fixation/metabolism regulation signal transduction histidine kinase